MTALGRGEGESGLVTYILDQNCMANAARIMTQSAVGRGGRSLMLAATLAGSG